MLSLAWKDWEGKASHFPPEVAFQLYSFHWSVKKVSAKTWRFVTRFTSQSSYFYGEHHWPNSTNVEKPIINPPYFINLLSVLKVEINFYSIRFGNIVALLAQVRICIILFLLTILFYMCIPCFGLLYLHEDHADAWCKEANCFVLYTPEILRSIVNPTRLYKRQHT